MPNLYCIPLFHPKCALLYRQSIQRKAAKIIHKNKYSLKGGVQRDISLKACTISLMALLGTMLSMSTGLPALGSRLP